MNKRYISNCCGVFMPHYPDSDFCPRCHEHCEGELEDSGEELEEKSSTSTEDRYDLVTLIEALKIFKKYSNKEYPIQCEANIMYILIDPSIVSEKDKLKLQGRGFLPYSAGPAFYSVYFGSAKGYSGQFF